MFSPSMRMAPPSRGISALIRRKVVDLPQPEGPTKVQSVRASIVMDILLMASWPPKRFTTLSSSIMATSSWRSPGCAEQHLEDEIDAEGDEDRRDGAEQHEVEGALAEALQ